MSIFETNRQVIINKLSNGPVHVTDILGVYPDSYDWELDTSVKVMEDRGEIKIDRKSKVVTLHDCHKMWNR